MTEDKREAVCPYCGRIPPSTDPLPPGWEWDADDGSRWCWCPDCMRVLEPPEES